MQEQFLGELSFAKTNTSRRTFSIVSKRRYCLGNYIADSGVTVLLWEL